MNMDFQAHVWLLNHWHNNFTGPISEGDEILERTLRVMSRRFHQPTTHTEKVRNPAYLRKGDHVRLLRDVDRYPHALIKAGAEGIVVEVVNRGEMAYTLYVQLNVLDERLGEWDNCLHWYFDDDTINDIPGDLEVLLP
jgi:hypothetical protein